MAWIDGVLGNKLVRWIFICVVIFAILSILHFGFDFSIGEGGINFAITRGGA